MNNVYQVLKEKYIDKRLKIFPIVKNGKTPLIPSWQNDCSYSTLQIMYWLENAPECNWGLPCTPNNLFVIDIDVHGVDGLSNAKKLFQSLGISEINTLSQKTPSGGLHLIFKSDDDLRKVSNSSNSFKDYPGIDIRTDGYIACNPSSINGVEYVMSDKDINEMPQELKDFILSQKDILKTSSKEKKEYVKPETVEEGGRDTALFEYITNLYYKTRLDKDEITTLAMKFNEEVCDPSLPEKTVKYKINKAFKKDRGICLFMWLSDDKFEDGEEDV